jgi:hypothetical protein
VIAVWIKVLLLLGVFFLSAGTIFPQPSGERIKFIVPPPTDYVLTILSQPECPIRIENPKLLLAVGFGNWGASFQLRNAAPKALEVQSITFSMWGSGGAGQTWEELAADKYKTVSTGQLITMQEPSRRPEVVPITDEIRRKMKLSGELKAVVVLMIEQIRFSDGTMYQDLATSKALQTFLANGNNNLK